MAVCDPLGLTVEGHTHAEMREYIDEALNLVLTNMVKTGEIEKFLRDRGWQAMNMPTPDRISKERLKFDIPIELRRGNNNGSARTAH